MSSPVYLGVHLSDHVGDDQSDSDFNCQLFVAVPFTQKMCKQILSHEQQARMAFLTCAPNCVAMTFQTPDIIRWGVFTNTETFTNAMDEYRSNSKYASFGYDDIIQNIIVRTPDSYRMLNKSMIDHLRHPVMKACMHSGKGLYAQTFVTFHKDCADLTLSYYAEGSIVPCQARMKNACTFIADHLTSITKK